MSVQNIHPNNNNEADDGGNTNKILFIPIGEAGPPPYKYGTSPPKSNPVNSLNANVRSYLSTQIQLANTNPDITAIVLIGGNGNFNFCAGADIREFAHPKAVDAISGHLEDGPPSITDLCTLLQEVNKPTVAAMNGVSLGGGLELALSCDYRVCTSKSRMGLPEVNIGLIPGAGGTQRLPRLTSVQYSLDVITTGRMISAKEALQVGLIDAIVDDGNDRKSRETLEQCAKSWGYWASSLGIDAMHRSRRLQHRTISDTKKNSTTELCNLYSSTKLPPIEKGGEAAQAAVRAIRASFSPSGGKKSSSFQDGMDVEEEEFLTLLGMSVQGKARRYAFFAERSVQQQQQQNHPSSSSSRTTTGSKTITTTTTKGPIVVVVGVIGAGTMGRGITLSFLQSTKTDYKVILVDVQPNGLEMGLRYIEKIYTSSLIKRRGSSSMSSSPCSEAKALLKKKLQSSTKLDALSKCHVVVEAVYENLELKRSIFQQLDKNIITSSPTTLLLTNTSTLDIDSIFAHVSDKRKPYCCGMHFFSPAHIMKLVEIVRGGRGSSSSNTTTTTTSDETIIQVRSLTKNIGKIGVVVKSCDGFVGNRMIYPYTTEACFLLLDDDGNGDEGGGGSTTCSCSTVEEVDKAIMDFGLKLGPFAMSDLAGTDIGYLIRKSKGLVRDEKTGQVGPGRVQGLRYSELSDDLVMKLGRNGQKNQKGWYDYDPKIGKGRKPIPSREVTKFVADFNNNNNNNNRRRRRTSTSTTSIPIAPPKEEIVERILFPLVNEGFKILNEGIATSPEDIDVVYLYGYGWPVWRGGPMYWAEHDVGLKYLLSKLQLFHERFPGSDYYIPSELLVSCVQNQLGIKQMLKKKRKEEQELEAASSSSLSKL